jgi:hypothetical protein
MIYGLKSACVREDSCISVDSRLPIPQVRSTDPKGPTTNSVGIRERIL